LSLISSFLKAGKTVQIFCPIRFFRSAYC